GIFGERSQRGNVQDHNIQDGDSSSLPLTPQPLKFYPVAWRTFTLPELPPVDGVTTNGFASCRRRGIDNSIVSNLAVPSKTCLVELSFVDATQLKRTTSY